MTSQVDYTANGTNVVFPFPFAIPAKTALEVRIGDVVQDVGFMVAGAGSADGGTVVFASAPAEGLAISLRYLGAVSITPQDANAGHLADKLAAGTGITLATVTEPGGRQSLVVNAVEAADVLRGSLNLSDLTDKAAARVNLDVYAKGEVETRDLAVKAAIEAELAGLSGVSDPITARTNLSVYSKAEVDSLDLSVKAAVEGKLADLSGITDVVAARTKLDVYSKGQVDAADAVLQVGLADLSGVTNVAVARTKLDVYAKAEVDAADAVLQGKLADLSGISNPSAARSNLGLDLVAYLDAAQDWTKPQRSQAVQTALVGGSTALDLAQYQNVNLTLTADVTFANPTVTAAMVGQKGTIGITPAGFAIAGMGSLWKRVGTTGSPDVITGIGRIDYHIRALDRIEYAYNDVEA